MATALAELNGLVQRQAAGSGEGEGRLDRLAAGLERRYKDRITGQLVLPAAAGRFAELPGNLHPGLRQALAGSGIQRIYRHQARAWELARAGRHLVIATRGRPNSRVTSRHFADGKPPGQGSRQKYLTDSVIFRSELHKISEVGCTPPSPSRLGATRPGIGADRFRPFADVTAFPKRCVVFATPH
jgi:hypothetical protein